MGNFVDVLIIFMRLCVDVLSDLILSWLVLLYLDLGCFELLR